MLELVVCSIERVFRADRLPSTGTVLGEWVLTLEVTLVPAPFPTKIGGSYTRSRGITLSPRASVLVTLLRAVDFARFVRVLPLPGQTAEQIFFSALLSAAPCRLRPLCPLQFFLKNYDSANQDTYTGFQ